MKNLPDITVQIIHIQGPLKGEIQEFSGFEDGKPYTFGKKQKTWSLGRIVDIWKEEGFNALLHRIGRDIQWFLMKP